MQINDLKDIFEKIIRENKEELEILKINPNGYIISRIPVMPRPARPATEMFGIVSRHYMTDKY